MSNFRSSHIFEAYNRKPLEVTIPQPKISDFFASNVFTKEVMKKYLEENIYNEVLHSIDSNKKIDRKIADYVANAMRMWAMELGATHFTHWFQPLTGLTAEKHDSFFVAMHGSGLEKFEGSALVQQEPDASSFPSGGIRATFEARGYTAWDPSSPAFIIEMGYGKTLCVPTIFISYTGESLDYKAPLLKSLNLLNDAAVPVAHLFDRNVSKVYPTLGWEQEYFLVDASLFMARPDLMLTGRTVIGHPPAKGQQLEDHYFGSIPERVYAYMRDFEIESLKLGIPIRTRHNEVAPAQFECAPMFEELNIAIDHNSLLMDVMDRVAKRHNLRVLFHEKPFAGVNGSGKHNNWSLATDTGKNLLSPGKTPKNNLLFLTFFINTIKAVNDNSDMIRASIASASNDHRLGANEAPPAIISVFIGTELTKVLNTLEDRVKKGKLDEMDTHDLRLNISSMIPDLLLDNTDRNRTSSFAFTGNKFEFRAVGSSANCAHPMTILNTAVASQLKNFYQEVDARIKKGEGKEEAILHILKTYLPDCKRILYEGNNYSEEWAKEAAKRGLNNFKNTPDALKVMIGKAGKKLMVENNILTERELHARYEIKLEKYIKNIQIESRLLGEMCLSAVIPPANRYLGELAKTYLELKEAGLKADQLVSHKELIAEITEHISKIKSNVGKMIDARKKANAMEDIEKMAKCYCNEVNTYFETIRYHADKLETIVDDSYWQLPKYREILFIR